jgi:N-acetyl-anhydromuramyl-L-alanine amidase AmpD
VRSSGKNVVPPALLSRQAKTPLPQAQVLLLQALVNVLITTWDAPVGSMEGHATIELG